MNKKDPDQVNALCAELPPLLLLDEVATVLRVSRRQLDRYIAAGRLSRIKMGDDRRNSVRVPRESLKAFLIEHLS